MPALLSATQIEPPTLELLSATQVDAPALDEVDGRPGNPFATALVEALGDQRLKLGNVGPRLVQRTQQLSKGFQVPDVVRGRGEASLSLAGPTKGTKRVALVIVHSRYTGWPALAGAAVDADRVGKALSGAGYRTKVVVDPSRPQRSAALEDFARRSATADVAILYSTGHGIMWGRDSFLLDSDFQLAWRDDRLAQHAIKVSDLGKALRAKRANLLFFGGCRDFVW